MMPRKWVNPCGVGKGDENSQEPSMEYPRLTDSELLSQIVIQAENALEQAKSFRVDYVQNTFNLEFDRHHDTWITQQYNWLPNKKQIPKGLGEPVPQDHLSELELNSALINSYENLQRFAVGLEQVVWDQKKHQSLHFEDFKNAEYKLRALLCEIQLAMVERDVKPKDDVDRGVMDEEYRELQDSGYRNLRDWLIYRDYMNILEYVIAVFKHLKSSL